MKDTISFWLDAAGRAAKPSEDNLEALKALSKMDKDSLAYKKKVASICEANLLLIPGVVRGYVRKRAKMDWNSDIVEELLQAGYFGLKRGVEKFDVTKGFRFSTYATTWIRQAVMRQVSVSEQAVRIPENTLNQLFYQMTHGRLSDRKGATRNPKLLNAAGSVIDPVSLDEVLTESGEPLHSVVPWKAPEPTPMEGEHTWASRMLEEKICEAGLTTKEADLIRGYGATQRLAMSAKRAGMCENTARPIFKAAIKKLEAVAKS
jgi:RNA polymerase sigma factor (sigma-70 family)